MPESEGSQQGTEGQQTDQGTETDGTQKGGTGTGDQGTGYPPEVQAILDKANREAAEARKKLAAANKRLEEIDKSQMTEAEKAEARIKELEARNADLEKTARTATVSALVTAAATTAGFANPSLANRLIRAEDIEFSDDGKPTNLDALMKDLLRDNPYLVGRRGSANQGDGREGGGNTGTTMNDRIRQAAGRA